MPLAPTEEQLKNIDRLMWVPEAVFAYVRDLVLEEVVRRCETREALRWLDEHRMVAAEIRAMKGAKP